MFWCWFWDLVASLLLQRVSSDRPGIFVFLELCSRLALQEVSTLGGNVDVH